jgi:hypothetical protein
MAGAVLLILVLVSNSKALGLGGLSIISLLFLARLAMDYMEGKANRMIKEERRAIRGARAEEKVGSLLESLDDGYLVIHDVTSPYGNIDHIVIGKESGVFLIETKAHGGRASVADGRLLVNGHEPEKDFIAQTLKNTYWLRNELKNAFNVIVWITPVLVFTNAFVERAAPIKGVTIINRKFLSRLVQKPNLMVQNVAVWENRERVQGTLRKWTAEHPTTSLPDALPVGPLNSLAPAVMVLEHFASRNCGPPNQTKQGPRTGLRALLFRP